MTNGRNTGLTSLPWCAPDNYLNITWRPDGQFNRLAEPFKPIDRIEFDGILHCNNYSLCGLNYDSVYKPGAERKGHSLWSVHYYLFSDECVAVMEKVAHSHKDIPNPFPPNAAMAKHNGYLYIMYFYRIGCSHPNLQHTSPAMFDQRYHCPDCGYSARFDSSG